MKFNHPYGYKKSIWVILSLYMNPSIELEWDKKNEEEPGYDNLEHM